MWALVIFGFGFMVSLILAIIFYTQIKDARAGQIQAESSLEQYATPEEQRSQSIAEMRSAGTGSVVGQLLADVRELKRLIIGSADASIEAI
jgi:hypothetical protein